MPFLFGFSGFVVTLVTDVGVFRTDHGAFYFVAGLPVPNQGWWSPTAPNGPNGVDFIVGISGGDFKNDYFTFDFRAGIGAPTFAELHIPRSNTQTDTDIPGHIYGLYKVDTVDAATLNTRASPNNSVYQDLGTGTSFGTIIIPADSGPPNAPNPLIVPLNAAAVADIAAHSGSYWNIGGTILPGISVQVFVIGSATPPSAWTINVSGLSPFSGAGSNMGIFGYTLAGDYTVAFTGPGGFAATWTLDTGMGPMPYDGVTPFAVGGFDKGAAVIITFRVSISPLTAACGSGIATIGAAYSSSVIASGGTGPYTYSLVGGGLPPGLSLNPATGVISGIPTASGSFSYTVQVMDSLGATATASCAITVSVPVGPGTIDSVGCWELLKVIPTMRPSKHAPVRGSNK